MSEPKFRFDEDEKLPTDFAIMISKKYNIYPDVKIHDLHGQMKRESDLRIFQQMSISCNFEDAMLAYYDRTFSDEQIQALKLIYRATIPWLNGEVVSTLLVKIGNKKITNKDFAESIRMIIDQLDETNPDSGEQKGTNKINGLAFKLAKVIPHDKAT